MLTHEEKLKELVRLDAAIKAAKDSAEEMSAQRADLERDLIEWFAQNGWQNISVEGRTVYKQKSSYVSIKTGLREAVIEWAKAHGFGEKVQEQIPPATLKALVLEWMGEGADTDQVPAELLALLNVGTTVKLVVRSA